MILTLHCIYVSNVIVLTTANVNKRNKTKQKTETFQYLLGPQITGKMSYKNDKNDKNDIGQQQPTTFEEALSESVRKFPCIYDKSDISHKDKQVVDAWSI